MNQSDIYHNSMEVWIYDQLEPNEELYVGRKIPREVPAWAEPFPDYLIGNAPPEITEEERNKKNDEFLKKHGI